jgi:hypothetical protein
MCLSKKFGRWPVHPYQKRKKGVSRGTSIEITVGKGGGIFLKSILESISVN